jgi:hypothetical protein
VQTQFTKQMKLVVACLAFVALALGGSKCPGMNPHAMMELAQAGVPKYVHQFEPATAESMGEWTKYTYDTDGGNGPLCIMGTPFTVFHQQRDPNKLVIFLNGGGACWQDFYNCSLTADENPPAESGIFADSFDDGGTTIDNPLADWSKLFVSYCDGSIFTGDNDVVDPDFQAFIEQAAGLPPGSGPPIRFHRGLRNMTAAIDLARSLHPNAKQVFLSGSSAGGYGVAAFAPSVFRFDFPPAVQLRVFDDAGPAVTNPALVGDVLARANDWQFEQFYPESCTDCDPFNQPAEFVKWTLENDNGYKASLYSTDGDATIRFFIGIPTQEEYRDLLLTVHDPINAAFPNRYKRFIRSGDDSHTSLRGDLFYTGEANGVPLYQWTDDFVNGDAGWVDIVEDFVPIP